MNCQVEYENGVYVSVDILMNQEIPENMDILLDSFEPDSIRDLMKRVEEVEEIAMIRVQIQEGEITHLNNVVVVENISQDEIVEAIVAHKVVCSFTEIHDCLKEKLSVS